MLPFIITSWNIEGMRKGSPFLSNLLQSTAPDLVFLSELQLYSCDKHLFTFPLYSYLNSEDILFPDLPLETL